MRSGLWLVVALCVPVATADASPLDKAAFTASPTELMGVAKAAPTGDSEMIILREDVQVSFDEQGRQTLSHRMVVVIRTQAGATNWTHWSATWLASNGTKPVMRARVIQPDGKVVDLDPKLLTDRPQRQFGKIASDRRETVASLPGLKIGSIVEQEVVAVDREPLFSSGIVDNLWLGNDVPTQSTRVSISAPTTRKLQVLARNLPAGAKPKRVVATGRTTWLYELSALPAIPEREPFTPSDIYVTPSIGFATAASWNAVARDYRKLTDQRIADGPLQWPASIARTPNLETVRAVTAWLRETIEDTGIDVNDSAVVSASPADIVKHKLSSGVERALVLVALLRQIGIRSELALLSAGPGVDMQRELPGLGLFDHVLVRARVAGRDVWIDPTVEHVRVGQLSLGAQGRRALVIANDTQTLVETPRSKPSDNVIREVRTFDAAELGPSRVTEVARYNGMFETDFRQWLMDTDTDEVNENFRSYVKDEFLAKLESHSSTPAGKLDPFELTLIATHSERVVARVDRIDIELFIGDCLDRLRDVLDASDMRRVDFVWDTPHVREVENRIVIPHGFTLPKPAPQRVRKLGTTTLTERQWLEGRVLVVAFRFETGKLRLSATEFVTTQKAIRGVIGERHQIAVQHTGQQLLTQGKTREALAEIDRLIQLHPKEALHHLQRSAILVSVGMGNAATRAARKAVELEPANPGAHVGLGYVLRRDGFGREYGPGHDRPGALAAYRKAVELSPSYLDAAIDLATLLERDEHGRLFEVGVDRTAAVAAWRTVNLLTPNVDTYANSLSLALLLTGDFAGAERVARAAAPSAGRNSLLVAAIAAGSGGPTAALAVADGLASGTQRNTFVAHAAWLAAWARSYDAARALYASAKMPTNPMISIVEKASRRAKPDPADPTTAVLAWMHVITDRHYGTAAFVDPVTETELRAVASRTPLPFGPGIHTVLDDSVASLNARVETLSKGLVRVEYTGFGAADTAYVVIDRGVAKLVGVNGQMKGVGRHILRLHASNELAAATRLIDWVRKDHDTRTNLFATAIQKIWDGAHGADAIALVGALVAQDPPAIPILQQCAIKAAQAGCDAALVVALIEAKRWREAEPLLARRIQSEPTNLGVRKLRALALLMDRKLDDADKELIEVLAQSPDDSDAVERRSAIAAARGNVTAALAIADMLVNRVNPRPRDLNEAAWLRLGAGRELRKALEQARQATLNKQQAHASALNTLAAIEAELGDVTAAKNDQLLAMERDVSPRATSAGWYVFGRIAEQLGLRDDAIAAYRMVTPSDTDIAGVADSHTLAQRRLQKL